MSWSATSSTSAAVAGRDLAQADDGTRTAAPTACGDGRTTTGGGRWTDLPVTDGKADWLYALTGWRPALFTTTMPVAALARALALPGLAAAWQAEAAA